jgi:hypothetical protein
MAGTVFDPYGSAGSSSSKAYKITLGGSDTVGDLAVMKARDGGKRSHHTLC